MKSQNKLIKEILSKDLRSVQGGNGSGNDPTSGHRLLATQEISKVFGGSVGGGGGGEPEEKKPTAMEHNKEMEKVYSS
ncbi:hypothetical protein [Pseudoalteromonas maricaloris]|uniref:hypothetical protein n=1 Tax=Pseudoalteromonas maricaloris TaxID=184924 RepID=UPI00029AF400|nr:hypothetical protein [Pseudoalteromonas flavipulchra]